MPSQGAKPEAVLHPGERASASGVYLAVHKEEHRKSHEVVVLKGDLLPRCRKCQKAVRFVLVRSCEYVSHDWDLAGPSETLPGEKPRKRPG